MVEHITSPQYMFKDRTHAGKLLAEHMAIYKDMHPLILALPRGGVPIGYEVAKALEAPLDTVVVRKIGSPENREFGIGAIAPGDVLILDTTVIDRYGISPKEVDIIIAEEKEEMERRMIHYRSGEYSKDSQADTIIIVDDGLATGVTARAAIDSVKINYKPTHLIFAAPICAREASMYLDKLVDRVVCVHAVDHLVAISYWYEAFPQVSDEEVVEYLRRSST